MAGDDPATAALSARAVKLRRRFKNTRRALKSTNGGAGGTLKSALELRAAVQSVKPAPKPDAKLEEVLGKAGRLAELANFQQSLDSYGSRREELADQWSPAGQQRQMLNQLVKMAEVSVNQHTGAGADAGGSRRASREIFQALKTLKNDRKAMQKSGQRAVPKPKVPLELGPDASVKELDQLITALRADDKQLKKAQVVFKKNAAATEEHVDELVEALSDGNTERGA